MRVEIRDLFMFKLSFTILDINVVDKIIYKLFESRKIFFDKKE